MWRLAVAVLICGVACAGPQAAQVSSPSPGASPSSAVSASPRTSPQASGGVPSPTPRPGSSSLLFAALKAEGTANPTQWNTVVLAGLDGYEGTRATFKPMAIPYVACAPGAALPTSAHVAAGKVFYAAGDGVIRSLAPGGHMATVATVPLTSTQQMLSFAVKPDGTRLLAAIFTLPPGLPSGVECKGPLPQFAAGDYTLDVYSAQSGGTSRLLYHEVLPSRSTSLTEVMAFSGWDAVGPFGTFPTTWQLPGSTQPFLGKPVRIDAATGRVVSDISDESCYVWDIAFTGDYVCTRGGTVGDISVRHSDGSEVWGVTTDASSGGYSNAFLSPMGGRVLALTSNGLTQVMCWAACLVPIAGSFTPKGWLDELTVIGSTPTGNLAYASIEATNGTLDLTFKGLFVGTVRQ